MDNSTSLSISLTDPAKSFVEAQMAAGGYGTASDYVAAVLLAEQKRRNLEDVEALALEGLHSGPSVRFTDDFWEKHRQELGLPTIETV
jgi:antitoxin ParD1/3/4